MNSEPTDKNEIHTALMRRAGYIALFGNLALGGAKIALAKLSGSLAVLGDGIDSLTDVAIALMTLIVSTVISRPSDREHPWGHGRAETTATMALSFVIFFAGTQLALSSVSQLVKHSYKTEVSIAAIAAAALSIGGKAMLAVTQYRLGKKSGSAMIQANAQNMKSDIVMSGGVLLGIGAARLFRCPILDPVTALLVSVWVIKNAIAIFSDTNTELMDGNTDRGIYKRLFDAASSVTGVSHPHRARIRKIASYWDIDLDIEVAADMSVSSAHKIACEVEAAVRKAIPDVYDIMVHVEPAGSNDENEQFGLDENDVRVDSHREW